jgi:hypothetical protein
MSGQGGRRKEELPRKGERLKKLGILHGMVVVQVKEVIKATNTSISRYSRAFIARTKTGEKRRKNK